MASHESMTDILSDSTSNTSRNSLSLLRKNKVSQPNASPSALFENNDDAERLELRRDINIPIAQASNLKGNQKRHSLGLSFLAQVPALQIYDRMSECIKLCTENKISIKNAFSVEIIDFMSYMIKKQDVNISNLQMASTSLDVSTKIYGFRVDGIHTEILKMSGGLDKQEIDGDVANDAVKGQTDNMEGNGDSLSENGRKKKKRKSKHTIFNSVESLRGNVETIEPTTMIMRNEDSQTTDVLCQVVLPNHANSGFYLHLYNDVIVDSLEPLKVHNSHLNVTIPKLEDFSQLEICISLSNFQFHGWTDDGELEEEETEELEEDNANRFQFDLEASLSPDDEPPQTGGFNFFDIDNEDEYKEECVSKPQQAEKIIDFREVVTTTKAGNVSEYSFIQKNLNLHWAGPSHWKLHNYRRLLESSKVVERCYQAPAPKRKEMEIHYDDDTKESITPKFVPGRVTKRGKNASSEWTEEQLTLPRDMHYDIANALKLYLHRLMNINGNQQDQLNATHLSDMEGYDYNNENDVSNYCPDIPIEDYEANEGNNINEDDDSVFVKDGENQVVLKGENLVAAPKLTNNTCVAYSLRAKRIDMRQLKRSIWNSLISINNKENLVTQEGLQEQTIPEMKENKRFSEIYKMLPNMLTKNNVEALSFPISFVSLLHLANEKMLKIESLSDMSDIIVEGN